MREFKFRVWDKALNKFVESYKFYFNGAIAIDNVWATQDCVVEQYTGLKDMNGVEIYEGDIIQGMSWSTKPGRKGPVYFEYGCFQWLGEPIAYDIEEHVLMHSEKWATVIGNIHQNSNLL